MARVKMVTREISKYYFAVKYVNVETDEIRVARVRVTTKSEIDAKKVFEKDNPGLVVIKVSYESTETGIYGMTEEKFLEYAEFIKSER